MTGKAALQEHLSTGLTHVCRCWSVERKDGVKLGFTDHDRPLTFEGTVFEADSGLSSRALAASTGLSVNNSEAVGLLKSEKISESDIRSGRFDGAHVTLWQVCWDDVASRAVRFRGTLGEITWSEGTFQADLRGLTEPLNHLQGRSFLKGCSAVLGDNKCQVDLNDPAYSIEVAIADANDATIDVELLSFPDDWFADGTLTFQDGVAAGLSATLRDNRTMNGFTRLSLWQSPAVRPNGGDLVKLTAGCDRRAETCREKFANLMNFRGFPDIPGEDWLISVPRSGGGNDGGSLR